MTISMKLSPYLICSAVLGGLAAQTGCGDGEADEPDLTNEDALGTDTEKGEGEGEGEGEKADAGPLSGDCTAVGEGNSTLSVQYASAFIGVEDSDKTYVLQTNWWYLFDGQTVEYDGLSFTVGNPNNADVGNVGAPLGYPSYYIGTYSGRSSRESNLPIQVSDIASAPTSFHTNATEGGLSNKNAAYDVWFTAGGDPLATDQYDPGAGGAYLMVWLFMPDDRQPRGANDVPGHTVEGVDSTWDVWIHRTDPVCISYVSTDPMDGLDFDLNHFIRDSVENDYGVTDDMYLSIIFAGFEIWGGGDGLTIDRFCASVY